MGLIAVSALNSPESICQSNTVAAPHLLLMQFLVESFQVYFPQRFKRLTQTKMLYLQKIWSKIIHYKNQYFDIVALLPEDILPQRAVKCSHKSNEMNETAWQVMVSAQYVFTTHSK